jgi:hypothetical protein
MTACNQLPKAVLRILDVYPGSCFLSIPDPGSRISVPGFKNSKKREGLKQIFCPTFFVATNIAKLKTVLIFNW